MLNKLTQALLIAITIELVIGGGRLFSFGAVSARMILFLFAMILTTLHILRGSRIKSHFIKLLLVFTAMLAIGLVAGIIAGADKKLIWEDLKPLLYFYLLPFFSLAITQKDDLSKIGRIIVIASASMAIAFLTILFLVAAGMIRFLDFYKITADWGEFFYRGEYAFYYKGFVYLCIAFIFVHLLYGRNKWWILVLFIVAILLTFTRGLIFALGLTYLIYYVLTKRYTRAILMLLIVGTVLFYGKNVYSSFSRILYQANEKNNVRSNPELSGTLLGDREFSDNERKNQIREVISSITPASFIWGHGFGAGVASRPVHMEISYLEIFHKQGLIGTGAWLFLFISLARTFKSALTVQTEMAYAFFLAALFVFFQSLTNQYINNPIGMGMLLISFAGLYLLDGKSPNRYD